ncbi:phospholipase D family protein [Pseudorhodobacter ferrugineus]|uniref:phospholipase D family protein n=1 Tax=Pseudorhodobacter ferrugineus TaxID=77008 RepID=UPI0003B582DA|nr:phospholipase D family protein [Pseudorhodobacter ferrugineus]
MLVLLAYVIGLVVACAAAVMLARRAFPPPVAKQRDNSAALPPSATGTLARAAGQAMDHPTQGKTGVAQLQHGKSAFAARIVLANVAVSSIDVQYYAWRADLTGYLLLDALQRAANRGVRVRLLLDDSGTTGLDPELAALNAHPNIEVRLYNPFNLRRFKRLSHLFDFFRLNRRMHNKSFTVDGHATIMGGRNVGNEYYGTGNSVLFFDLDVLAIGAIVSEVSADFDKYWAAPCVHLASLVLGQNHSADPIAKGLARFEGDPQYADYCNLTESAEFESALAKGDLGLEWAHVLLISDDPVKGEGAVPREDLLAVRLMKAVGKIETKFDGISPYLVPGRAGVNAFAKLTAKGVSVRMLTNSLDATDMLPVHAGYAKRRMQMLRRGVGLFELHAQPGTKIPKAKIGPFGSSGSSLHAKTFAVDGKRIFIGSFNFDPRSTTLNTEMGLLIQSEDMANGLHSAFDQGLAGIAWRVEKRGLRLVWIAPESGEVCKHEPGTTLVRRIAIALIGWLPVEWLL